ncbi:malonate transporter subunit MadL [Amaricoccus solimangrovi]|uniref:Malonate transporter subunit MadL n=1 Tax=Amaricoccus solimangrovi TaxID=2589815 RepID=A0A501WME2_9RHOB|nr:malonate transporter subunit MadL [Amaricoccus solimangrovi]TPE50953.1 malonate transporter subunit MadL [Amaricoccus solimangrovi]
MIIYGVAILSACLLAGVFVGDLLGNLIGVQANVGGVGFAMLLLIFITDYLRRRKAFCEISQMGIGFWSAMYIPIVVAMAAQQNVVAAVSGGPAAILAGVLTAAVCVALVPVIARVGGRSATAPETRSDTAPAIAPEKAC